MFLRFVESCVFGAYSESLVSQVYLYICQDINILTVTILPFTPHRFHPATCWLLTLRGFSLLAFSSHQPNKSTGRSTSPSLSPPPGCLSYFMSLSLWIIISLHHHQWQGSGATLLHGKHLICCFLRYHSYCWGQSTREYYSVYNKFNLSLPFSILIKNLHDFFPQLRITTWQENLFLNRTKPWLFCLAKVLKWGRGAFKWAVFAMIKLKI